MCIWLVSWIVGLPGQGGPSPVILAFRSSFPVFCKSPGPKDSHSHTRRHPFPSGSPRGHMLGSVMPGGNTRGTSSGLGCREPSGALGSYQSKTGLQAA